MDTASGFILTAIENLAAERYRRVISEKRRDALARLRAKGRRVSRWAPYGWRFGPGGQLVRDPKEVAVVRRVARLAASVLSLRLIARTLANRAVVARCGRPFAPSTLSRILREGAAASALGDGPAA